MFFSPYCLYKASISRYKSNTRLWILFSIVILLFPAVIRNSSVGTDVAVYQIPLLKMARNASSFAVFYKNASRTGISDLGYLLIVYLVKVLNGGYRFLFFIEELLAIVPIVLLVFSKRKELNVYMCLVVYNLLFYVETYNCIRQMLAVSFFVLSIFFYSQKRYACFISALIAISFHRSAIIIIIVLVLFIAVKKGNIKLIGFISFLLFTITLLFSKYYYEILIVIRNFMPFIPDRYFSMNYLVISEANFHFFEIYCCILGVVFSYLYIQKNNNDTNMRAYLLLESVALGAASFAAQSKWGYRILWYFYIFEMYSLSSVKFKSRNTRLIVNCIIIICPMILYWIYYYYLNQAAGIFPYEVF